MNTDRQPEDNYCIPEVVDPDAVERLARRSLGVTGIPQMIHGHGEGEPCRGHGCRLLES